MKYFIIFILIEIAAFSISLGRPAMAQDARPSAVAAMVGQPHSLPTFPPRLSAARLDFYKAHPTEFTGLLAKLPQRRPPSAKPASGSPWQAVATPAPADGMSNPILLTDGTVIIHASCTRRWYRLTPDNTGSYVNGTWSTIASLPAGYAPLYFASQILDDGRVVVNGGEYNDPTNSGNCGSGVESNLGAIYDPDANTWTALSGPKGWSTIGDAESIILPNGLYMLANCCTTQEALLDLSGRTPRWMTTGAGKADTNSEEGWTLQQDGTVLTVDAYVYSGCGRNTEFYAPSTGSWASTGNARAQISDCRGNSTGNGPSYEVGPLIARSDGSSVAFSGVATGAVAGTSIFDLNTSTWSRGPDIPAVGNEYYNLADAPAAVLPGGGILFAASPGLYQTPVHYFAFSKVNSIIRTADPPNAPVDGAYFLHFVALPTGQILQTDFSTDVEIFTPGGTPSDSWAPTIIGVPKGLTSGQTYRIRGTQMNGVSFGVHGDDQQSATSFPLVRITNAATGHVAYAKTLSFSSRSDAPGRTSTASFVMPSAGAIETGPSSLVVVANGIESASVAVTVY